MKIKFKHASHDQSTHGRWASGAYGGSGGSAGSGVGMWPGETYGQDKPIITGAELSSLGVSKVGKHWDYREAAKHGVGSFTRTAMTKVKVGQTIDDYLPSGEKAAFTLTFKGSWHYKIQHASTKEVFERQYHPVAKP